MSSSKFREWVSKQILNVGPLPLSVAMNIALTHQEFGYYHSKKIIGDKGDFITAPEISQMFGELVGVFLGYIWQESGKPADSLLCEFGPGHGTLSEDVNRALKQIYPKFAQSPLHLIELSKSFKNLQKNKLKNQAVFWHDKFRDLPRKPIFAIANEFFDSIGVDQAIFDGENWRERLLNFNGQFELIAGKVLNTMQLDQFDTSSIRNPECGTIIEYSSKTEQIVSDVTIHIKQFGGALLIIDYGKMNQIGDTIQAVSNHKPADIWSAAGDADISHWVDFKSIKKTTEKVGGRFIGPVPQAHFLTQIGIKQRAQNLSKPDDPKLNRSLFAAVDRLISPSHMGNLFQVGLILPPGSGMPPGFRVG